MRLNLSDEAKYVLEILNKYGDGYLVGGAVRDYIIGIEPSDFDFATNISQQEIMQIFKEFSPQKLSSKYEVTSFMINDINIEIARFREDVGNGKNRNPQYVVFKNNIKEDLKRRDFTINALAYNIQNGLIDLYGGLKDISKKKIRFIGDPNKRISEDIVRLFRAFKYSAKLNFNIDDKILQVIRQKSKDNNLFNGISKDRFRQEIENILLQKYSYNAFRYLIDTDISRHIFNIYKLREENKNQLSEMYMNYRKITENNLYSDMEIVYSALFIMLGNININFLQTKYGRQRKEVYSIKIAREVLLKLGYGENIIDLIINNIKLYTFFNKNISLNNDNAQKGIYKFFEKTQSISKMYILYRILNRFSNKKQTDNLLKNIQQLKWNNLSYDDLEIYNTDIYNMGLNEYESVYNIRQEIKEMLYYNKINNNRKEILKYLYKKYNIIRPDCSEDCGGSVVYKKENGQYKFLLVKVVKGNWGFAKGHIENDEKLYETAIREVKEETNIDIDIIDKDKFNILINYVMPNRCIKNITYYLGRSLHDNVILDKNEIAEYKWLTYKEAYKLISYYSQRKVLLKANIYLKGIEYEK